MKRTTTFTHEMIELEDNFDILFQDSYDTTSFIPRHWHDAIELIYLLDGELDVEITSVHYALKTGDIMIINSKVIHSTKCIKGNHAILLQFPYPFLVRYIKDLANLQFILNNRTKNTLELTKIAQLKTLLEKMLYIYQAKPDGSALLFQSLLFETLFSLYHNFSVPLTSNPKQKVNKNLPRLEQVLQYTNEHYADKISLSEISALLYMQPAYFCRFFKTNMGSTYLEYLNDVRLSHIYHDLLATDYCIHELLERHGFTNYKLFRRLFFEKFKTTPFVARKKTRHALNESMDSN